VSAVSATRARAKYLRLTLWLLLLAGIGLGWLRTLRPDVVIRFLRYDFSDGYQVGVFEVENHSRSAIAIHAVSYQIGNEPSQPDQETIARDSLTHSPILYVNSGARLAFRDRRLNLPHPFAAPYRIAIHASVWPPILRQILPYRFYDSLPGSMHEPQIRAYWSDMITP
jgi:hypothetical protein